MSNSSVYIGLTNPKSPENVGMVLRAAGCYEAQEIFYNGERFDRARKFWTDTKSAGHKIPLTGVNDLLAAAPSDAIRVAVELVEGAIPLMDFVHPQNAYYIFGPEDGSLKKEQLEQCAHVVYIPTVGCMNLAATVNVVLYDRMAKSGRDVLTQRPVIEIRDTNNNMKIGQ